MRTKVFQIIKIILLTVAFLLIGAFTFVYFGLKGIPESYIKGDVPDMDVFHQYLLRDLTHYFSKQNDNDVKIEYILLRDNPTQVGLSSSKFYLWVTIKDSVNENLLDRGALVVGANNKESFTITNFISKKEINSNPELLNNIFPEDIVLKIKQSF